MIRKGRIYHTHQELKDLLLDYYKDAIDNGYSCKIHAMRSRGLTGGRMELVKAWDALAIEGKLPPREKRKLRTKDQLPSPRPEKPHRKSPVGITRQCVSMYGRKRMILEHRVIASWLKTRKPASKTDISIQGMEAPHQAAITSETDHQSKH